MPHNKDVGALTHQMGQPCGLVTSVLNCMENFGAHTRYFLILQSDRLCYRFDPLTPEARASQVARQ